MKKIKFHELITIFITVMLLFTMVGCGDSSGDSDVPETVTYTGKAGSETYTLVITENLNRAAYTPQAGDFYELKSGSKISTGTVVSFTKNVFVLSPSGAAKATFTITVSGTGIVSMTGTITWDDGKTDTAPDNISPQDGIDAIWTALTAPAPFNDPPYANPINGVAYGAGKFVIAGELSQIAYSSNNGSTWNTVFTNPIDMNMQTEGVNCVVFYNNLFFTGGTKNTDSIITYPSMNSFASTDGVNWTDKPNSEFILGYKIYDIAWANGTWVAVGETNAHAAKAAFSTDDGVTWHDTPVAITGPILGIAYGAGKFVVVGQQGQMYYSTSISAGSITWAKVANPGIPSNEEINDIAWSEELKMFVAVGHGAKAARSSDGITWTSITMPFTMTGNLICVASGGGKFIVGGTESKAAYSSDGITWTAFSNTKAVFETNPIYDIAYGNGIFIAVGANGKIAKWDGTGETSGSDTKSYNLTVNIDPAGSGTVTKNPNKTSYDNGTSVTVTANAKTGFIFSEWTGAASGTSNSVKITMNGNKTLTAKFVPEGTNSAKWKPVDDIFEGKIPEWEGGYNNVTITKTDATTWEINVYGVSVPSKIANDGWDTYTDHLEDNGWTRLTGGYPQPCFKNFPDSSKITIERKGTEEPEGDGIMNYKFNAILE